MIKFIAAIDEKRGIADDTGMPWFGKLTKDLAHFRQNTEGNTVIMGYRTYESLPSPLVNRRNLVVIRPGTPLHPGFEGIEDAKAFIKATSEDVWIIGGVAIFEELLTEAGELYLTRIASDFACTKFFPEFESSFELASRSEEEIENGISFHFELWKSNKKTS